MAYIDRDKAIAYVEEQYRLFKNDESKQAIVDGCVEALKFTPTADVVEVKHGEWEKFETPHMMRCSECGVSDLDIHRAKFAFVLIAVRKWMEGEIHNG